MKVDIETRVAQYVKLRDTIKAKEAEFKERIRPYKETLEALNSVLLNHLTTIGGESVRTESGTVYKTEKVSASLSDPAAFMKYVIDNKEFDLMDRKANVTAVTAYIEEHGTTPPGVKYNSMYVAGVRRPTEEK